MKNKQKIILVKSVIATGGILTVSSLFLGISAGIGIYGELNNKIENIAYVLLGICVILGATLIILMCKIDIRPEKAKPKKYQIKFNEFNKIELELHNKLIEDGYAEFGKYQNDIYSIDYSIKYKYNTQYVIGLLNIEELTEEIYEKYKKQYFEEFGNYVIEEGQINPRKDVAVIYIICVSKKNKVFTKYVERNVCQYFGRYNLPVGIDLEKQTVYIASQNEGIAKNKYNKLKKILVKYFNNMFE